MPGLTNTLSTSETIDLSKEPKSYLLSKLSFITSCRPGGSFLESIIKKGCLFFLRYLAREIPVDPKPSTRFN